MLLLGDGLLQGVRNMSVVVFFQFCAIPVQLSVFCVSLDLLTYILLFNPFGYMESSRIIQASSNLNLLL